MTSKCDKRGDHLVRGTGYSTQGAPPAGKPFVEEPCEDCDMPLRLYEMKTVALCERRPWMGDGKTAGHRITLKAYPLKKRSSTSEEPWASEKCERCGGHVIVSNGPDPAQPRTLEQWKEEGITILIAKK